MAKVERGDTVRKGVRVTLRACIWPLYWVQNGPDRPVWVPCGPAFRVPPELFGQFHDGVLGSSGLLVAPLKGSRVLVLQVPVPSAAASDLTPRRRTRAPGAPCNGGRARDS